MRFPKIRVVPPLEDEALTEELLARLLDETVADELLARLLDEAATEELELAGQVTSWYQ
jgi:hypothetical protein